MNEIFKAIKEFFDALGTVPEEIMPDVEVVIVKLHAITGKLIEKFNLGE